jgi:drug/metabolite transporter (DMT)-like permease
MHLRLVVVFLAIEIFNRADAFLVLPITCQTLPLTRHIITISTSCRFSKTPLHGQLSNDKEEIDGAERQKRILVLTTVPFAWGTFEPAAKYVYGADPPIPAFVFSTAYYMVAAMTLLTIAAVNSYSGASSSNFTKTHQTEDRSSPFGNALFGGLELGMYLFIGNALQLVGLRTVEADRAAFLLQLTTIFVPLLQRNVSLRTWIACFIALVGVGVMGLEGNKYSLAALLTDLFKQSANNIPTSISALDAKISFSVGDFYIMGAALAYTFHCIRIESYAKSIPAVQLAAAKASSETMLSATVACGFVMCSLVTSDMHSADTNSILSFCRNSGQEIVGFVETLMRGFDDGSVTISAMLPSIFAILWTGWISCAYTIAAQSYGQALLKPVTANLIYTLQPVCTAAVAWLILSERLQLTGFIGGTLIGGAVLLVATGEK